MKRIILSVLAAAMAAGAYAEKWSLDSCVSYAVGHNIEVRQRLLAARQGELQVTEARDRVLPSVSGYASESFSFGRGLTADNTYANRNTSAFSVGASLSLPLFQGLRVYRNIEYSRTSLRALLERSEATKDNVTLNVISQYLQVLYSRENLQVALLKKGLSETELKRRQTLLEAGKIPELDLFQAEAQLSQDELSVVNARNDSVLAMLDLANLLSLTDPEGFDIMPFEGDELPLPSLDEVWANASNFNHGIRASRIEREAAEKNLSIAKAGMIPSLSFNAGIGTNAYRTSGFQSDAFGSQLKHNFSRSLGFSLSVPIFDAFSTRNSIRRAKLQILNTDLSLENELLSLHKTITTAHAQAVAAAKKEVAAQAAVESTKAAFEAMTVKYDNGRANSTEYEQARTDYVNAMYQKLQARYENLLRVRIIRFYNKQ